MTNDKGRIGGEITPLICPLASAIPSPPCDGEFRQPPGVALDLDVEGVEAPQVGNGVGQAAFGVAAVADDGEVLAEPGQEPGAGDEVVDEQPAGGVGIER